MSACSSGSEAIAHAWRQIILGDADIAVCGGVEGGIEALPIAAFSMMRAMSTRNDDPEGASRPFDKDRDGFVFGEAGALMVIETEEHAKARGAKPLARLMGPVSPPMPSTWSRRRPTGSVQARRWCGPWSWRACRPRTLTTSTPTRRQPRSATPPKPTRSASPNANTLRSMPQGALGHSIGAVGALESVLTVLTLRDGVIPPTLNYETPDPEIDLDIVAGEPRYGNYQYAINNSFGFGGHNVALAFGRY
ncbi:3-oxoacyl-[acyl-carrier-protein] synthase 1 [Mycobacterium xenopi 3993]|nr:3-oxoacyl-[acyl-carrier-protein] synthase 1 [Mycobacterium xenopi 3993]